MSFLLQPWHILLAELSLALPRTDKTLPLILSPRSCGMLVGGMATHSPSGEYSAPKSPKGCGKQHGLFSWHCGLKFREFSVSLITETHPSLPCSTSASPTVQSACDCRPIVRASQTVRSLHRPSWSTEAYSLCAIPNIMAVTNTSYPEMFPAAFFSSDRPDIS